MASPTWTVLAILLIGQIGEGWANPKKQVQPNDQFEKWMKFLTPSGQILYGHVWSGTSIDSHPCEVGKEPTETINIGDLPKNITGEEPTQTVNIGDLPNRPPVMNHTKNIELHIQNIIVKDMGGGQKVFFNFGTVGWPTTDDDEEKRNRKIHKRKLKTYGPSDDLFNLGYQIGMASAFSIPNSLHQRLSRSSGTDTRRSGKVEATKGITGQHFIRVPHTIGRYVNKQLKKILFKLRPQAESMFAEDNSKTAVGEKGTTAKVPEVRAKRAQKEKGKKKQQKSPPKNNRKTLRNDVKVTEKGVKKSIGKPAALINYMTGEIIRSQPRALPAQKKKGSQKLKIKLHNTEKSGKGRASGKNQKKNVNHIRVKIKGKKGKNGLKRASKKGKRKPVKVLFKNVKPKSRGRRSIDGNGENKLKKLIKLLKEDPQRQKIRVVVTVCVHGRKKCQEHRIPHNITLCTVGPGPSKPGVPEPGVSYTKPSTEVTTEWIAGPGTPVNGDFETEGGLEEDMKKHKKQKRVKRFRRSLRKVRKSTDFDFFPVNRNFSISFCLGTSCPPGGGGKKPGGGGGGDKGGSTPAPSQRESDLLLLPNERYFSGVIRDESGHSEVIKGKSGKMTRNGSFSINFCLGSKCGGGGGGGGKGNGGGGGDKGGSGGGGESGGEGKKGKVKGKGNRSGKGKSNRSKKGRKETKPENRP